MNNWPNPSDEHRLYLPYFDAHNSADIPLQMSSTPISVSVEDIFVDTWTNGPKNNDQSELQRCLRILGMAFGRLAKEGQGHVNVEEKGDPNDLVTDMDKGIECLLRVWLAKFYPHHKIIGEEGLKDPINPNDIVWYIDPIDGTSNFVDGKDDVSMHLAAVGGGSIYASFTGLPIKGHYYSIEDHTVIYNGQPLPPFQAHYDLNAPVIGTEYLSTRDRESAAYTEILNHLNAQQFRVKSIGVNLIHLLMGKSSAFYKPATKLWDVIAPLGLINVHCGHMYDIELTITNDDNALSHKNAQRYPVFSNDPILIEHINKRHLDSCRIGLITVTPKSQPSIKTQIFEALYK